MSLLEGKRFLTYVTVALLISFVVITIDSIHAASDSPQTATTGTMDQSQNQCTGATPITNIQTSGSQSGFPPSNVDDKNLDTLWSTYGLGSWIQLDLGSAKKICSVDIAWYKGNQRQTNFVVSTSSDGVAFTDKLTGKSSGTTLDPEKYGFPLTDTRYIKVTVNGNTQNNYASLTELHVFNSTPSSLNQYLGGLPPTATTGKGLQEKYVFVKKWGSEGTGDGQFQRVHDLDFDPSEKYLYVVDRDSNRIQVFDKNGTFLWKWGSKGTGNGQFTIPYSVDVDSQGNVWIADRGNHRIQKFDKDGNFLFKFGSFGSKEGQFDNPRQVAVDKDVNFLYIADSKNNRVQKFDTNGTFIKSWGSLGSDDGQFNLPVTIIIDSKGDIIVNERGNNRVQKFDPNGNFILKFGSTGTGDGHFSEIEHMATDKFDNIYVNDPQSGDTGSGQPRVQKFDNNGNFITKWGSYGTGDGQFIDPEHLAIDSEGNVYVSDRANNNIQVFEPVK